MDPPTAKRPRQEAASAAGASWQNALSAYVREPARFAETGAVVLTTPHAVVIRDKYPKSTVHLLALPRSLDAPTRPADLRKRDAAMVRALYDAATEAATAEVARQHLTGETARIRYGFHAAPSMRPLHLHAIGQDFAGPNLKTAKHWNSFTSAFFVEATQVIAALDAARDEAEAATAIAGIFGERHRAEELLKQPLQCHRCSTMLPNMPRLKAHIAACQPGTKKQ